MDLDREFPAKNFQSLVGARIESIVDDKACDEGFNITFTDGRVLNVAFSGCEGTITIYESERS